MKNRQEVFTVKEGTADQEFTVCVSDSGQAVNENVVNEKTLEAFFKGMIDTEKGKIVDTVEDMIQEAILTAKDSINNPKIKLDFRSISAASGRDATIVMSSSKQGEYIWITAPLWDVSERNNTLHVTFKGWESKQNSGWG